MPSDAADAQRNAHPGQHRDRRAGPTDRNSDGYAQRQEKLRFRDWRFRVKDILKALDSIAAYTDGMTLKEFAADQRTFDAVIRNLVTMGESIRWIPEPILDAHPDIPWRTMRGVRNVVVHEYFGVDSTILWSTIRHDLPPLVPHLEAMLRE
jgi:uncharacterized protein with HEPN domain